MRALSLAEILDSLHDRFRLLTGGARTAVRRQQTLRASVDWSHALLTEPERVLFRRLAVFLGGFDLDAAQAVAGGGDVERYQVLDQLTLLVDKSLVVADDSGGRTRYRLLETVRQYALEKLGESGEADAVRSRHRDHYTAMAALLDAPAGSDYEQRLEQAEIEIDNLRAAFGWSRENSDIELALALASSLQPLWQTRGRIREGLAWFDAALADLDAHSTPEVAAAVRARALADRAVLAIWMGAADSLDQAQQALAIAREVDDPALLARALTACGFIAGYTDPRWPGHTSPRRSAWPGRWTIGGGSARSSPGRRARRSLAGDPIAARAAAEEGRDLADAIGDRFDSRQCRCCLGVGTDVAGRSGRSRRTIRRGGCRGRGGSRRDLQGGQPRVPGHRTRAGRVTRMRPEPRPTRPSRPPPSLAGLSRASPTSALATAALAAGDAATAQDATEAAWQHPSALAGACGGRARVDVRRPRWRTGI